MKRRTLEQIDAAIKWRQARIRRDVNAITKLEGQRKRLLKVRVAAGKTDHMSDAQFEQMRIVKPLPPEVKSVVDDLTIPAFLQREAPAKLQAASDKVAEAIREEIAERKRKKAQGRIAKMKAKQSGDTKRMPLTGKEALAAIRAAR